MKKLGFLCALCASVLSANAVFATEGALSGKFSINEKGDQVQFAQGNIQYQASTKTWRFAAKQYESLGAANAKISASNSGWIDLFAWGTGNNPASVSSDYSQYASFNEWGANAISNGGNKANAWRTLTRNEWVYILTGRKNATNLLGAGTVNGVKGIIILPDNWAAPAGVTFNATESKGLMLKGTYYKNANGDNFAHNIYSAEQWAKMEAAGAVFLPTTGYRYEVDIRKPEDGGCYWTSNIYLNEGVDEGEANSLDFDKGYLGMGISGRDMGFAVRLVCQSGNEAAPAASSQPAASGSNRPAPGTKRPVKR